jgi:hypothetical protein
MDLAGRRFAAIVLAVCTAGVLAGCQAAPSPVPSAAASPAGPPLSISNGTSIPVMLAINGSVIEIVPPGDRQDPITASLPPRPWAIETRSPGGRVLSVLSVGVNDYVSDTMGRAVRVDLTCGRLDVWSGPPLLGPTFIPGPSGDCD